MATFTESFNKADGAGLGPDLTWTDPGANWATASNRGVLSGTTAAEITARAEHDTGSADMYVELMIPDFGASSYADVGMCLRMSADRQTFYCFKRVTTSGGEYTLRKYIDGTLTALVSYTTLVFSFPEMWRFEVEGNELRAYRNDVLIESVVDSEIAAGSFGGLNGFRNNASDSRRLIFDDFEVGSLDGGGPITEDLISAAEVDVARSLAGSKAGALSPSVETDVAQPLAGSKAAPVPVAVEISHALGLSGSKATEIPRAGEADVATNLLGSKSGALLLAAETDLARPLTGRKVAVLETAVEVDEALDLATSNSWPVETATEIDVARPFTGLKTAVLPTAVEADRAVALFQGTSQLLEPAIEVDIAFVFTQNKSGILFPAIEIDLARPIQPSDIVIDQHPTLIAIQRTNTLVAASMSKTLIAMGDIVTLSEPYETYIKRGDTPTKEWTASDDLDTAVGVRVIVGSEGGTPIIDRAVDSVDGNTVTVVFTEEETATAGHWNLEVEADFSDGVKITYPERGYCRLYIEEDLG